MPKPPKKKDYSKLVSDIFDDQTSHLIDDVISSQPESDKTTPVEKKAVEEVVPAGVDKSTPPIEDEAELSENDLAVGEDQFLDMLMDNLDSNEEDPELSKFLKEVSFEVTDLSGLPLGAATSAISEEGSTLPASLSLPDEPAESSVLPVHRPDKTEERRAIPAERIGDLSLPLVPISYPASSSRPEDAQTAPVERLPEPVTKVEAEPEPEPEVEQPVEAAAVSAVEPEPEPAPAPELSGMSFRDALENLVQLEPAASTEPVVEMPFNPFEEPAIEPAVEPEPTAEIPLWAADEVVAGPAVYAETPEAPIERAAEPEAIAEPEEAAATSEPEEAALVQAEAVIEAAPEVAPSPIDEPQPIGVESPFEEIPVQPIEPVVEEIETQPVEAGGDEIEDLVVDVDLAELLAQLPEETAVDESTFSLAEREPEEAQDEPQILPGSEAGDELLTLLAQAIEEPQSAQIGAPVETAVEDLVQPEPVDAAVEAAQQLPAEEEPYLLSGTGETAGDYLGQIVREIESESRGPDLMGEIFGLEHGATIEAANLKRHLVFSIGPTEYAVPILNVSEVVRPLNVTPVPNLPDWVSGVANLRGDILSVVDLRVFLGREYDDAGATNRMLVVHAQNEDITMGLIVDRVGGIFDLPEEQIRSPSAPIDDKISAYMRGVSDYRERLFVVLDLNRLLLSPEIQQFQ